jgi:hypothetical protein
LADDEGWIGEEAPIWADQDIGDEPDEPGGLDAWANQPRIVANASSRLTEASVLCT